VVWEVILVEELEHGLHPLDGRDLSAKLDKVHARAGRINGERTAEVVRISGILVDLGMLPIKNISQLLKSCRWLTSSSSACKKHWPPVPVRGTEFWDDRAPTTSGRPPRRSSAFFFFLALRNGYKIHVNIYIYIHTYINIHIRKMEILCRYTLKPSCPQL
jgi:hypothetical protein